MTVLCQTKLETYKQTTERDIDLTRYRKEGYQTYRQSRFQDECLNTSQYKSLLVFGGKK